jgi:hypothetical protein
MRLTGIPLSVVVLVSLLSCDVSDVLDEDLDLVVESYLVVGEDLPTVRLSRTVPVGQPYSFSRNAVSDAVVEVSLLDSEGEPEKTFQYRELTERRGNYVALDPDPVLALRTYRLDVAVPGRQRRMRGETLVPGGFEVVREGLGEVVYQGPSQFALGVTRSVYPDRQALFMFTVEALQPSAELLTPFYREIVEPDDPDSGEDIEDFVSIESQVINELNYDILDDGTLTVKLPWFAVAFYGPHRITVSAIDNNLYDFLRSHNVQQGGSTLAPGEIPNPINRIDGGTGIFGSLSRIQRNTVILPPR